MRKATQAALAILMLVAVGCGSSKPKDLIIGKWEPQEEKAKKVGGTAEFKDDGTFVMSSSSFSINGKYKFVEDDVMEMELDLLGQKQTKKYKVEISGDDMTTTELGEGKEVEKYKRK